MDCDVGFLEAEAGLSREIILSRMGEKISSCHGIVSWYGALYCIGRECGVDIGDVYCHTSISGLKGGKPIRNRDCQVCGAKVPIDDFHCLKEDPMVGQYKIEFKTAKEL